jgi:hypothetical protein
MNQTSPSATKQGNQSPAPGGNSPVMLIAIVIGVIVVGAVGYKVMHKDGPDETATQAPVVKADDSQAVKSKVLQPHEPVANVSSAPAAPALAPAVPVPAAPVVGPAKDLVNSLAAIDPRKGPLTKEQAEKWKQDLKSLVSQGGAAVPAIREFLDRNVELSYRTGNGGDALGYSSLRSSMIDALQQIGGPEATQALLGTLGTTALPSEIQQIAQALNQTAPGQYSQDVMNAARQTLDLALNGSLCKEDAAPLFKILESDPNSADQMQKAINAYKYYPAIALEQMPNDAGVPTLVKMSKDPNAPSTVPEMLAEKAATSQDALVALQQMVKDNRLTPMVWQEVISLMSGDQYVYGNQPQPNVPGQQIDCQYFHIEFNNQNYSKCKNPTFDAAKGIAALNQIAGTTTDPNIRTVIQQRIQQLQGGAK